MRMTSENVHDGVPKTRRQRAASKLSMRNLNVVFAKLANRTWHILYMTGTRKLSRFYLLDMVCFKSAADFGQYRPLLFLIQSTHI